MQIIQSKLCLGNEVYTVLGLIFRDIVNQSFVNNIKANG